MDLDDRIHGYPPVIGADSRVLIVGSMPSVESLAQGFYYAHPRNAFWRILSDVFGAPLPVTIEDKKHLILENRLALWDVYASCERKGSLDSAIRNGEINDFSNVFRTYPFIRAVLANGGEAYRAFPKAAAGNCAVIRMPSTSPAFTMPYSEKLFQWKQALSAHLKEMT